LRKGQDFQDAVAVASQAGVAQAKGDSTPLPEGAAALAVSGGESITALLIFLQLFEGCEG
jgi:hypothetical protein